MTTDFAQEATRSGTALYGSQISVEHIEPFEPATFRDVSREYVDGNGRPALPSNIRVTDIRITDLRTGWQQRGDGVATSASTLWQAFKGHLLLPPRVTQATLSTAVSNGAIFHAYVRDEAAGSVAHDALFMGPGADALSRQTIYKETSATDPTPSAVLLNSLTVNIVSISWLPDKPSSSAIVYGFDGSTAAIAYTIADGSSGSSTTGHANTANLWGCLVSNINASVPGTATLLLYAGTSIYTLPTSSAFSAAPTQVLSNIPGGGTAVGIEQLQKNWLNRAYWLWPRASRTVTAVGTAMHFDLVSTNLEGTGPEWVPTKLNRVRGCVLWNRLAVRWDDMRVTVYDGETEIDLHVLDGRQQNSDYRWGISSVTVQGGELYVWVVRMDMTVAAGTLGLDVLQMEKYMGVPGKFVNVSMAISAANSNAATVSTAASREMLYGQVDWMHTPDPTGIPVSKRTGFVHLNQYNSANWDRFWLPPEGVNPFTHFVKTGANNEIAQQWAASGTWTSNKFPIANYHGKKSVVIQINASEMDLAAGGSGCSVQVATAKQDGTSHTFDSTVPYRTFAGNEYLDTLIQNFLDNRSAFTLLQLAATITQDAASTYKTPNALPVSVRVMTFLSGPVRSAREVFTQYGVEL